MSEHIFVQTVRERFGGRLARGTHEADSVACPLEAAHAAVGDPWSDRPDKWPDIRPLADAPWSSDQARTEAMVPVLVAYWDWAAWTPARQQAVMAQVVIETVRQLIAQLPELPAAVRIQCQTATTLPQARGAAQAAEAAAAALRAVAAVAAVKAERAARASRAAAEAAMAAWAAARAEAAMASRAAAEAASRAARAAAEAAWASGAAADQVLRRACTLWIAATTRRANMRTGGAFEARLGREDR